MCMYLLLISYNEIQKRIKGYLVVFCLYIVSLKYEAFQ